MKKRNVYTDQFGQFFDTDSGKDSWYYSLAYGVLKQFPADTPVHTTLSGVPEELVRRTGGVLECWDLLFLEMIAEDHSGDNLGDELCVGDLIDRLPVPQHDFEAARQHFDVVVSEPAVLRSVA